MWNILRQKDTENINLLLFLLLLAPVLKNGIYTKKLMALWFSDNPFLNYWLGNCEINSTENI